MPARAGMLAEIIFKNPDINLRVKEKESKSVENKLIRGLPEHGHHLEVGPAQDDQERRGAELGNSKQLRGGMDL